VLYDLMAPLMPSLRKGSYAFRPSQQSRGAASMMSVDQQPSETEGSDQMDTGHLATPPVNATDDGDPDLPPLSPQPPPPSSPQNLTPSVPSTYAASTSTMSTSSSTKHKQSALDASQLHSETKRAHTTTPLSGAVTLNGIKENLVTFNNTIEHTLGQPDRMHADTSPEWQSKAMDLIQEKEGDLCDEQLVALIDLFQGNTGAADAYISLKHDMLCWVWVQKHLIELSFPQA
jgi:hypothetical protein